MSDRRTDGRTDRRMGKNNMSPDPVGGRHNEGHKFKLEYMCCVFTFVQYNILLHKGVQTKKYYQYCITY